MASTAARRGRFTAFALLLVVADAYIEEPHLLPHEDAWDGRSVQEKVAVRATDKPGAKPKPGFGRISAAELGKRFASSELGKHVGKFGAGLSELMLGGTKRLTQAVSQAAGASPFGIGVDPKAVKADHEAMLAWWCAQPGEASSSTCTRHAAVSKLRGEKDASKRKAIFDAVKAAAPADAAGRAKALEDVQKMIKAWCKTDDHKASSITCQSARASNIFGKLHEGAKGAATSLVGRRRLEALAALEV